MKFEKTYTYNIANAIYSARNPMESWGKSDSDIKNNIIGESDLKLAQKLILAGGDHRKFMRQIFVSVDITAPLYWWKEFDTYKVGTVANSTSTMHKLSTTPITIECFELDDFEYLTFDDDSFTIEVEQVSDQLIHDLEKLRVKYLETQDKRYWRALIQLLPSSWLQTRTVTMNYENILNMIHSRGNHKLIEWTEDFIGWTKLLPYSKELLWIGGSK